MADYTNGRIQFFTTNGVLLGLWGSSGSAAGQFSNPHGVSATGRGEVYVADTGNDRIQVFTSQGAYLRHWGVRGSAPGQLLVPATVTVDATDTVYVADAGNHRIQVFTRDGVFVRAWGSYGGAPGQFRRPWTVAVGPSGEVFVTDADNKRVQVFTPGGEYLRQWSVADNFANFPIGLVVDRSGIVLVSEHEGNCIRAFTSAGGLLWTFGKKGSGPGEFVHPNGLSLDAFGNLFVADETNHRIQVFASGVTPAAPSSWGRLKALYR